MKTRLFKKSLNNSGDTIVEVLISIAIVSLILAISYATTNHNVRSIQDAQERSHAIQLAQRQIEFLKSHNGITPGQACYDTGGGEQVTSDCVVDDTGKKIISATQQPAYQIQISGDVASQYSVNITWHSLLSSSKDNLTMYYRP